MTCHLKVLFTIHWSAGCWDSNSWGSLYSQLRRRSVRGREGVEQDDTGTYALSGLFRSAVFRQWRDPWLKLYLHHGVACRIIVTASRLLSRLTVEYKRMYNVCVVRSSFLCVPQTPNGRELQKLTKEKKYALNMIFCVNSESVNRHITGSQFVSTFYC